MAAVENKLRAIAGITSVSLSFDTPTYTVANSIGLRLASWGSQQSISLPLYIVDENNAESAAIAQALGYTDTGASERAYVGSVRGSHA